MAGAVVQAVGAVLPELDDPRGDAVAAPLRRALDWTSLEALRRFCEAGHQLLPGGDHSALLGRPCAELRGPVAGGEVRVGLLLGHDRDWPLDAKLTPQRRPVEDESGA